VDELICCFLSVNVVLLENFTQHGLQNVDEGDNAKMFFIFRRPVKVDNGINLVAKISNTLWQKSRYIGQATIHSHFFRQQHAPFVL